MYEIQANPRNQAYGALFGVALIAVTAVLWDFAYNNGGYQGFLLGVLFALAVAAFGLLSYSEAAVHSVPRLDEPKRRAEIEEIPEPEPAVLALDATVVAQGPPVGFEKGEIRLETQPKPKQMGVHDIFAQQTAHILCGVCGDYFELDVQPARPLTVECVACESDIVIDGTVREEPSAKVNCRHCHAETRVPTADTLASFHCAACGTMNEVRAIGASSTAAAGPWAAGGAEPRRVEAVDDA